MSEESEMLPIRYQTPKVRPEWILPEENMPESALHDQIALLMVLLLQSWASRTGLRARVARNLAIRWDERHPRVGVDPDVSVLSPPPPEAEEELSSVCTWKVGHHPPLFALEVVSNTQPRKDYESGPERYNASGTKELCVFDPVLVGPRSHGGPFRLQLWRRVEGAAFERVYEGEGPVYSPALSAWLFATDEGRRLRVADDKEGTRWWLTEAEAKEAARKAEETARKAEETARKAEETARKAAEQRISELEAELECLRGEAGIAGVLFLHFLAAASSSP